jgi:hypothetical protein
MNAINRLKSNVVSTIKSLGAKAAQKTPVIVIGNGKTGKSIEGVGGCPLMSKAPEGGKVNSPICPSCYAVDVLNNYPQVRKVVMGGLPSGEQSIEDIILSAAHMNKADKRALSGSPIYPGDRLRLYGLTDFSPMHMASIRILATIYKLDIISKTLHMNAFNRSLLVELAKLPNINISLSFNSAMNDYEKNMDETRKFILAHNIGDTVGMNFTFTSSYKKTGKSEIEEIRPIAGVGVYHIVKSDKHSITRAFNGDDSKVCGIFTASGDKIKAFGKRGGKSKPEKGSCEGCTFCRDNVLNNVLKVS